MSDFCDPIDCSLPGSSVHGIFQARILEWVAMSISRGSSQPRAQTPIFCIGRQILYHCATWEAHRELICPVYFSLEVVILLWCIHYPDVAAVLAGNCIEGMLKARLDSG